MRSPTLVWTFRSFEKRTQSPAKPTRSSQLEERHEWPTLTWLEEKLDCMSDPDSFEVRVDDVRKQTWALRKRNIGNRIGARRRAAHDRIGVNRCPSRCLLPRDGVA